MYVHVFFFYNKKGNGGVVKTQVNFTALNAFMLCVHSDYFR